MRAGVTANANAVESPANARQPAQPDQTGMRATRSRAIPNAANALEEERKNEYLRLRAVAVGGAGLEKPGQATPRKWPDCPGCRLARPTLTRNRQKTKLAFRGF